MSLEVDRRGVGRDAPAPLLTASPHLDEHPRRAVPRGAPRVPAAARRTPTGDAGVADAARRVLDGRGPRPRQHRAGDPPVGRRARSGTSPARPTSASRSRRCSAGRRACARTSPTSRSRCAAASAFPPRYVSGYLFTTDDATGEDPDAEAVRVQTHAWFEAADARCRMARARPDERSRGRACATSRSATAATTTTSRRCAACSAARRLRASGSPWTSAGSPPKTVAADAAPRPLPRSSGSRKHGNVARGSAQQSPSSTAVGRR